MPESSCIMEHGLLTIVIPHCPVARILLLAALMPQTAMLLNAQTTAAEFAQRAYATLPVEESYAFHKAIGEWREPLRRDPAARLSASEIQVPPQGWKLLIRA